MIKMRVGTKCLVGDVLVLDERGFLKPRETLFETPLGTAGRIFKKGDFAVIGSDGIFKLDTKTKEKNDE